MATKPKLTKKDFELLEQIAIETKSGGFIYADPRQTKKLQTLGLVITNPGMVNEQKELATKATDEGLEYQNKLDSKEKVDESKNETAFVLETGIEVPKTKRGRSGSKYPFSDMKVGESFHVATCSDNPNPAKRLASSVSSANKKAKSEDGSRSAFFIVRRVAEDDPKGEGARVFRVE